MVHLVIILSVITTSLACAPKSGTGNTGGGGGTGTTGNTGGGGGTGNTGNTGGGGGAGTTGNSGRKRDVDHAQAIIVTKANFNPKMNPIYMNAVKFTVEQYAYERGLIHNHDLIREEAMDIGGKFAIVFTIFDVDCDQVYTIMFTNL
ncbi:hypothetical protein TELCIR_24472 [Teladorsagia circumcincta]|uniref:Cystatin domain-containing protein n=1 Tax=Teladorsagia circumcincta TaxID=45464 RepID=A0A2G9T882_TELCI|nr:hypothetical protein TELCIR_24472 [Teladorsagia circumcincta]